MKRFHFNLRQIYLKVRTDFSFLMVSRFFLKVFLFIFPFQLSSLVFKANNFFSGNFNPFLSYSVYFAEIFLLLSLLFFALSYFDQHIFKKTKQWQFLFGEKGIFLAFMLFVGYLFLNCFFAENSFLAFLLALRHLELFGLYLLLINRVISFKEIFQYITFGLLFQVLIAFLQYFKQGSLGLGFLGEPQLGVNIYDIAKIDTTQGQILRPYGTFPHANVLGGAIFFVMGLLFIKKRNQNLKYFILFIILLFGLILSFSRTAFFAFLAMLFIYFAISNKKINMKYLGLTLSLILFFVVSFNLENLIGQRFFSFNDQAITDRVTYSEISIKMFRDNIWGNGLGSFVQKMQDFNGEKLLPWNYQPVHNTFLLLLNELGWMGLLFYLGIYGASFFYLFRAMKSRSIEKKYQAQILFALGGGLICISLFDHYTFTLFQGLTLFYLYFGIIGNIFGVDEEKSLQP